MRERYRPPRAALVEEPRLPSWHVRLAAATNAGVALAGLAILLPALEPGPLRAVGLAFFALQLASGLLALTGARAGRVALGAVSALGLLGFPVLTAVAVYTLWALRRGR